MCRSVRVNVSECMNVGCVCVRVIGLSVCMCGSVGVCVCSCERECVGVWALMCRSV